MRNCSLWSNIVFEKEVISHSNVKRLQAWSLWYKASEKKHTNLCNKGVFSVIILLLLRRPIEPKFSPICYVCVYVGLCVWTQQVRVLVFDNYHRCPIPCKTLYKNSFFIVNFHKLIIYCDISFLHDSMERKKELETINIHVSLVFFIQFLCTFMEAWKFIHKRGKVTLTQKKENEMW